MMIPRERTNQVLLTYFSDCFNLPFKITFAALEEIAAELGGMLANLKNPPKKKDYFQRKREMEEAAATSKNLSKEVEFDVLGKPGEQEEHLETRKSSEKKDFIDMNKK